MRTEVQTMNDAMRPVVAHLEMKVGFHPKNVCCDGCDFCRTDAYNRNRLRCAITWEIIFDEKSRGLRCPLKFEEDDHV